MGEHTNGKWFNLVAWGTTIVMVILTIVLVITGIFPNLL
jgi:Mn2+/Fe2+ NRAMP family transporter